MLCVSRIDVEVRMCAGSVQLGVCVHALGGVVEAAREAARVAADVHEAALLKRSSEFGTCDISGLKRVATWARDGAKKTFIIRGRAATKEVSSAVKRRPSI